MIEIISHIATNEIPSPGIAGHMAGAKLRDKVSQTINLEKLRNAAASGCPVNKKTPTSMSKESFIKSCNVYRGVAEKDRGRKNKFAISTLTGFKSSNKRVCLNCEIGEKVAAGKEFDPPLGITFEDLEDVVDRPVVRLAVKPKKVRITKPKPTTKGVKLTKQDVIRIRKMHDEGYSVPGLCEIFPITTSTMYRVVNRESWRNVE